MGINTIIFFPLSPDYLVYVVHKDNNIDFELLSNMKEDAINNATNEIFDFITSKLIYKDRITEYIIIPNAIPKKTKLRL